MAFALSPPKRPQSTSPSDFPKTFQVGSVAVTSCDAEKVNAVMEARLQQPPPIKAGKSVIDGGADVLDRIGRMIAAEDPSDSLLERVNNVYHKACLAHVFNRANDDAACELIDALKVKLCKMTPEDDIFLLELD